MSRSFAAVGIGILIAGIVSSNRGAAIGVGISKTEAMSLTGGEDCGNEFKTKSVNCSTSDNEGHSCDGNEVLCSTSSHDTLQADGAGKKAEKDPETKKCIVCGSKECGTWKKIPGTKDADCKKS